MIRKKKINQFKRKKQTLKNQGKSLFLSINLIRTFKTDFTFIFFRVCQNQQLLIHCQLKKK